MRRKIKRYTFQYGRLYFKRTYNNMFLTTVSHKTGNVIASFSSKMFKAVDGKRQSFALILFKKLGFIVGLKTMMKRFFDVQLIFQRRFKMHRFRVIMRGLRKSGLRFRKLRFLRRVAHNGCRGKSKRRV